MKVKHSVKYVERGLTLVKSLAMRKMEKNFIAVNEKGYPRSPYAEYDIKFLLNRIFDEYAELENEFDKYIESSSGYEEVRFINNMMWEIADVINVCEYLYEKLSRELDE